MISAHFVMILMIPLSPFYAVLKGTSCKMYFIPFLMHRQVCLFFGNILFLSSPTLFLPSVFASLISLHHPSPAVPIHSVSWLVSIVWRLYTGQLRHHPVTWLPRLLPPQPELHMDNRDLPWQRLAGKFCVNHMPQSNSISLTMSFPPSEWPLYSAEHAVPGRRAERLA